MGKTLKCRGCGYSIDSVALNHIPCHETSIPTTEGELRAYLSEESCVSFQKSSSYSFINKYVAGDELISCEFFEHIPGMVYFEDSLLPDVPDFRGVPDVTSPATKGCLLHIVRKHFGRFATTHFQAHGGETIPSWTIENARYNGIGSVNVGYYFTESDALIRSIDWAFSCYQMTHQEKEQRIWNQ